MHARVLLVALLAVLQCSPLQGLQAKDSDSCDSSEYVQETLDLFFTAADVARGEVAHTGTRDYIAFLRQQQGRPFVEEHAEQARQRREQLHGRYCDAERWHHLHELALQALANEDLAQVFLLQKYAAYPQDFERHHKYKTLPPDLVSSAALEEELSLRASVLADEGLSQRSSHNSRRRQRGRSQLGSDGRNSTRSHNTLNHAVNLGIDDASSIHAQGSELLRAQRRYAMDAYLSFFERDLCQFRQLLSSFFHHVTDERSSVMPYLHVCWVSGNHPRQYEGEIKEVLEELVCDFGEELVKRKLRLYVLPAMGEQLHKGTCGFVQRVRQCSSWQVEE